MLDKKRFTAVGNIEKKLVKSFFLSEWRWYITSNVSYIHFIDIFFVIGHSRKKIGFCKCFDVHPSLLGQIYTDNETDTVITILFEQKKALKHDFDS